MKLFLTRFGRKNRACVLQNRWVKLHDPRPNGGRSDGADQALAQPVLRAAQVYVAREEAAMSAIPAASVSLKTMADGTLRMTFDIEPTQAKDAFSLFAAPGTPVAIAALQVGYAAKSDMGNPISVKEPLGPLAKWLVIRCGEPEFWDFLSNEFRNPIHSEPDAAEFVKELLGVASRKDVDTNLGAQSRLNADIRHPYQKWLVRRSG